ncbi:ribosome silencing factor [Caloranaerobacter azorensis]|uniref:Ribosomal silencing factor RsfS n=1 Tax=Caloranaerobacter azorensis DSM 13643 TaxID=1121264 RepID=A0A1M5TGP2_9FIRM|nr:ribosome silencing factor [Caloranaerobacter azorensis]SHH49884.1 ribosome-associated protein [Caloranaerobacter azorensis DSM 13643]
MANIDNRISVILEAADDKKAFDIKLLDISDITTIADFFVFASGNNERQVIAIVDEIEDKMYQLGYEVINKEGYREGRWVLLDFGDIIVHVFHKEDREFYNLDRLWIDAKEIDIDNII